MRTKKGQVSTWLAFTLVIFIIVSYVFMEIAEDKREQKLQQQLFDTCLNGCINYENNIPYDEDNSRVVYFDYCANDCNEQYGEV